LREDLYSERFKREADGDPIGQYARLLDDAPDWLSPLEQQMHIDLRFHLSNDMLVKVDRMSMAHSLEVRVPWLDREVLRTCLAIPPEQKRRGKRGKLPLRSLMEEDLPRDLVDRKKTGFLSPIESWLRGPWQPLLRELLSEDFADQTDAFSWPVLQQMLDTHQSRRQDNAYPLFALLILAVWWKTWISGDWAPRLNRPSAKPTRIHRLVRHPG
jgi:asparagine synthase (glutamine-hydrolysing)